MPQRGQGAPENNGPNNCEQNKESVEKTTHVSNRGRGLGQGGGKGRRDGSGGGRGRGGGGKGGRRDPS